MPRLYTKKELLFLGVLFFAALISLFFFIFSRTLAFPEHNIAFDITREEATKKAEAFARTQNYNPKDFKETTIFSIDDTSKTYLEREVGVTETARLADNDVDVWHFTTRLFKPSQQEELTVSYLPNGRFSAYYLELTEEAKGAQLSRQQALDRAEGFLARTVNTDLKGWKLVNSETTERPNRIDHAFTWEKNGFKAKDATYRMEVHVYGDRIGTYYEYLKIPEAWTRAYYKETSNNDLAQTVAESIMLLVFGLGIVTTFIIEYRRNNLRIGSLKIIAVVAAIISILTALNSVPLALSGYPTTMSWEAFLASVVLVSILGGLFEGASVLLVIAAGEAKFREMFPKNLSLESTFTSALQTKSVNKALFVGVFAGIIFFSYELVYYFLGKSLGFWAPAAINYSDIYSTILPWIYPVFIGFLAAASEEGIFRLFGIPFLKKYLKSTWVAIIITAIVWGFLHSNYPQSPWFVRGIEISIIGVVLGWVFVRFGFLASFSAHFTFNALQTAISFYQSGNLYASISSTFVSLLPFIIAVGLLGVAIYRKGFAPESKHDLNEHIKLKKLPDTKIVEVKSLKYQPFAKKRKSILIGLSILSLVAIVLVYPKTSLEEVPISIDRGKVLTIANETLSKRTNITDYKTSVTFTAEDISLEEKYIQEEKDFQALRAIYPDKVPFAYWSVRYFKPLQKEEYIVDVLPNGKIYQIVHAVDEKASGANLTTDQAQTVVEHYLSAEKGYKLANYTLVENKAEKKEKRTDHVLVYEEKNTQIGDAQVQTEVRVIGDEVSGFTTSLKLPEAWVRDQNETTTLDFVVGGVVIIFVVIVLGFGYKTFFTFLRAKKLNFHLGYKFAGIVSIFSVLVTLNSLTVFYDNYDTAIPLSTYILQSSLTTILGIVFSFFMVAVVVATFIAIWKEHVGQIIPEEQTERVAYLKDAVLAGFSIPIIVSGIVSVLIYVLITKDWMNSVSTFSTFPQLDTYLPLVAVIGEFPTAIVGMLFFTAMLLLLKRHFKTWKRVSINLAIIAILLALPQQRTAEDIATSIAQNILILLGGMLVVRFVLGRNLVAYGILLFTSLLLSSGWVLFVQPNLFFMINGGILLLLALIPAVIYFFPKLLLEFKFGRMVQ